MPPILLDGAVLQLKGTFALFPAMLVFQRRMFLPVIDITKFSPGTVKVGFVVNKMALG